MEQIHVIIHDEMDPVTAIVVGDQVAEPFVYVDHRGMYDRPATYISVRDFAEWLVIEFFSGATVHASTVHTDQMEYADENFVQYVKVLISQ